MALRTPYCLPVDVLRKFDPTLEQSDLDEAGLFDAGDAEKFEAEIEDACGEFDSKTGNAQRLTEVGRGGAWEYHDAELRRYQGGVKVFLDHRNVLPFDSSQGDTLEIRTSRENWRDITSSGDRWRLNAPDGVLQIFTRRVSLVGRNRRSMISDNIRITYRYGALGGSRNRPGQTSLSGGIQSGDSSFGVENADRLPRTGVVLIGGDNPEYVWYDSVDRDNDQITGADRGRRGTEASSHNAGDTVHYCAMDVRKAVAGHVASEFVRSDDIAANLSTPDDNISHSDRIEDWKEDWRDALGKYSEAHMF